MEFIDKKILVVEDDDMLRHLVFIQLTGRHLVTQAKDGEEGLKKIESDRPDLIVLDLMLPKVDGFELLEKLRNMPDTSLSSIPVIVVSNLADAKSIERAQKFGIEEYFTKIDISFGTLLRRVERVFGEGPKNNYIQP